MGRYDKYEPYGGGFRAELAADFGFTAGVPDRAHADLGVLFAVGLNTDGRVVKGAGTTGIVGILILTKSKAAGSVVDVMTDGEIVDVELDPGTVYEGVAATGAVIALEGGTATGTRLGFAAEAGRMVVRVVSGVGV